jgi:hypothetical protein
MKIVMYFFLILGNNIVQRKSQVVLLEFTRKKLKSTKGLNFYSSGAPNHVLSVMNSFISSTI